MHKERIKKLQALVAEIKCDAYLVEDPVNLFYLTGIELSAGRYVVTADDAKLYVDGRYIELCRDIPAFPIENASLKEYNVIAFNKESTTYSRYERFEGKTIPVRDLVAELRMIKDAAELNLLREAASLGSRGYDYIRGLLKEGISEVEVAIELDIFWKRQGGKAVAFEPIIAFGANSSMPHYRPRDRKLKNGDIVLLDIGVTRGNYHSDMTRVEFFGEPSPELQNIYEIVRKAQQEALKLCKPGTLIGDLDAAARDYISQEGYSEEFCHSLGHGIGIEVHEAPTLRNKEPFKDKKLQAGMVITIEPGIYLPGKGGVRLEDTVAITSNGHENFTNRPIWAY